jgi:hypothetical protein
MLNRIRSLCIAGLRYDTEGGYIVVEPLETGT